MVAYRFEETEWDQTPKTGPKPTEAAADTQADILRRYPL